MHKKLSFVKTDKLNKKQFADLEALSLVCKKQDEHIIALHKHLLCKKRPLPSTILCYQKNKLLGFLSAFFFYKDACEIALMVKPNCRHQGIATKLLHLLRPLFEKQRITRLIFSSPKGLNDQKLEASGFQYQNSEYQMHRLEQEPVLLKNDETIKLRQASVADFKILCDIDKDSFPNEAMDAEERFRELLKQRDYSLYIAELDNKAIGKIHLHWQGQIVRFSDIGILIPFRRRGYATDMIAQCMNQCLALQPSKMILDVETKNQSALNLYQNLGFVVANAYDFWSIETHVLFNQKIYP